VANTLISPTIIAREALAHLLNNMVMGNLVHRQYVTEFGAPKVGSSVRIRKPVKFITHSGADVTNDIANVKESYESIDVDTQINVPWQFLTADLTLTVDKYNERYIEPAGIALANDIDYAMCGLYTDVHRCVGTPGETPESFSDLGDAAAMLDMAGCPQTDRRLVLDPTANWSLADALKGLFLQQRVEALVNRGYLGTLAGMDILMDQNIRTHTPGGWPGTPAWDQAAATETYDANYEATNFDGFGAETASSVKIGDVVQVATVYDINPISRAKLAHLKHFTVIGNGTTVGTEPSTPTASTYDVPVHVRPAPIYYAGSAGTPDNAAFSTVDSLPADGDALTVVTHTAGPQNLAFHKNAFALVVVPLEMPDGASFKAQENYNGVGIRVIKDYNILTDYEVIRLDVLYGKKALYPDLAVRLLG